MEMTENKENMVTEEEKEQVRFSVEDAQNVLQEDAQRKVEDGQAEVQEVLDRRNLRLSVSMTSFEDGRNIPNVQLVPRQNN